VLLGSFLAPLVSRFLSVRAVLLELWTWLGCGLFLIWPDVYVLVAGILLDAVPARAAVGLFAAVALLLVVWSVLSPSITAAPSLDELDRQRG
jgi:hypothetical protein